MKKIATHNSATGEPGRGILSWLVLPFSKCQSKTILEQYDAGCRFFDLRVRYDRKAKTLRFAHGLWTSSSGVVLTLYRLALKAKKDFESGNGRTYIMLTYEWNPDDCELDVFHEKCEEIKDDLHESVQLVQCCVKRPTWITLWTHRECPKVIKDYEMLGHPNPRTLLPIPRLWAWLRGKTDFNDNTFKMVDFL